MWPDTPPRVVLLDADGNLFPSEEPAFAASCTVTNDFLAGLGSDRRFTPEELQAVALGRNFRALARDLADEEGRRVDDDVLARWVTREQVEVTEHLAAVLRPAPEVTAVLRRLHARTGLAVVSSSALARLGACLRATGLDALLPAERCYSAQDSLPVPTSKPDPAVYAAALAGLGADASDAVAVEDAVAGVRSAVGAGIPVVGNLAFVRAADREVRETELLQAGAHTVAAGWSELGVLLGGLLRAGAPADSVA